MIIYDSKFGNISKIANTLKKCMKECNIEVDSIIVEDVKIEKLQDYDLLAIGGSTFKRSISNSMSNFLEKLEKADIRGLRVFPFDTKLKSLIVGSTGKTIEEKLKKLDMIVVKPYYLTIFAEKGVSLQDRIEATFRRISADLARILKE